MTYSNIQTWEVPVQFGSFLLQRRERILKMSITMHTVWTLTRIAYAFGHSLFGWQKDKCKRCQRQRKYTLILLLYNKWTTLGLTSSYAYFKSRRLAKAAVVDVSSSSSSSSCSCRGYYFLWNLQAYNLTTVLSGCKITIHNTNRPSYLPSQTQPSAYAAAPITGNTRNRCYYLHSIRYDTRC